MSHISHPDIPVLTRFEQVADRSVYEQLPEDWHIGIADVVNSTGAIAAGRYKSVNFAGAATISAVSNAVGGRLPFFAFGGDGAHFAVPPEHADAAATALLQVASWVKKELDLELRVGMVGIGDVRYAGFDVRAAYWKASQQVKYTLFTGGGLEWAERELKAGAVAVPPQPDIGDPDLTGLSCQWGPVSSAQGTIMSLIVKPAPGATPLQFEKATRSIISALEKARAVNPVPQQGPDVRWPSGSIDLQSRVGNTAAPRLWKSAKTIFKTLFYWSFFKISLPLRGVVPDQYRADIAANSDYQKYNDGLMMTVDCSPESVDGLKAILQKAEDDGAIRYGIQLQEEALITCVVPSSFDRDHMHFIDGSGGGYASAAKQLRSVA